MRLLQAAGVNSCEEVTETHLALISNLYLSTKLITSLKIGDFDGLSSLERLHLIDNQLSSLPEDIFDGLSSLKVLMLAVNQLSSLSEDIFDGLSSLEHLRLTDNHLTSLPVDVFDGLSSLDQLELGINRFTSLPEDIFDGLSSLTYLSLLNNQLTSLSANLFDGLSSLEILPLFGNQLTNIEAGTFEGLSSLDVLFLNINPGETFSFTIALEKVEGSDSDGQFKAVMPTGAPFSVVLPLIVTNGSISGDVTSVTIPIGSVESSPLTVTRTSGTTGAVTLDIGTLPSLPRNHYGYTLVKSDNLPLTIISGTTSANAAPVFSEGTSTSRTVAENTAAGINIGDAVGATDADNNTLTYTLGGTDAATFDIDSTNGQLKTKDTLNYEDKTSYSVTITVSDSSLTDTINVSITVTDIDETIPNRAPIFTEGESTTRIVAENTEAGVHIGDTVAATDPDGNTLAYTLGGTDATAFEIDSATGQLKTKATLDYETKNTYSVTITVSDGSLTDTISVTINISNVNEAPMFIEGDSTTRTVAQDAERGVNIGTPILATDADDDTLTYTLDGTDAATFDIDSTIGQLKTKVLLDVETKPFYTVTVTASDGSFTDIITVTINIADVDENNPPVFTEGDSTTRTVAEKTLDGVEIGTAIAATDADNDTLIYTLGGTDAAIFEVEITTGQLKTKKILDFETQFTYKVTLTVSDGSLSDTINVTITVTDIDETVPNRAPVFTDGDSTTRSVAENTAADTDIGTAIAATDPDGNTLIYTLGGTDAATFDIDSTSGQLKTKAELNYETKKAYTLTITVSDSSLTDVINININVTNENDAPIFTEGNTATRAVAENTETGANIGTVVAATDPDGNTLAYTLGGTDADVFAIDNATGQLKTKVTLDYETKKTYSVTITASDGSLKDTITVTINITDIVENRVPVFTEGNSATRSIAENTNSGVDIGTAVSATDEDNDTLTYTLGGTDAASFAIVGTSGQLKTSASLDYEDKTSYSVTITVSDGKGGTDSISVTITVTDVTENRAPVFTDGENTTRSVAENTATDINIGTAVAATDADNDTLTYTLGGTDATSFAIVGTSGQLKTSASLDYEDKTSYSVTITVSDGKGGTDSISVTITVTDVTENRAPVFTDGENTTRSVAENTTTDTNIGTAVAATDADNDTLTYTLSGTDAISFAIENTTGHLKTKATLNYETKSSYLVTVSVSDDNGGSDSISVTITVTDITQTTFTAVCDRTPEVRDALVTLAGVSSCNDVTEEHLAGITYFSLYNLSITSLKTGDFDGLSQLQTLDLNRNQLTSLPENVFDELTSLTRLLLYKNQLTSLPEDVFDGLSSLSDLRLSYNKLTSLPEDVFDGLSSMSDLHLSSNEYTSLPEDVFDGLSSMINLDLSYNKLTSLPEDVFDGLSSMSSLFLTGNELTSLPEDIFDGLSSLRYLPVNWNKLTSLPEDVFDGLSSLSHLWLESNQFTSLPEDVFDGLSSLSYLWLERNQFTSLPEGILDGLSSLLLLTLSNNAVDPVPLTVTLEKVGDNQFKATMPTGAPFSVVLPISVTNGSISGDVTSVTIPTGNVESSALTVTRTSGTTNAVTVDIGTLPSIPSSHYGYALVKPTTGLPLEVIAAVSGAPTSISNTTPQVPEVTAVMPNYPNPFNPETWIPYQLAKSADVSLTFYNIRGVVVRRLVLGHRAAGVYYSRSRAAHWDGRNSIGEKVATGTYFCTFTAGDFITTRKMVIRK